MTDPLDEILDEFTTPGKGERYLSELRDKILKHYRSVEEIEAAIGEDDRDYSQDNADPQSLRILVACSSACNELRADIRRKLGLG